MLDLYGDLKLCKIKFQDDSTPQLNNISCIFILSSSFQGDWLCLKIGRGHSALLTWFKLCLATIFIKAFTWEVVSPSLGRCRLPVECWYWNCSCRLHSLSRPRPPGIEGNTRRPLRTDSCPIQLSCTHPHCQWSC